MPISAVNTEIEFDALQVISMCYLVLAHGVSGGDGAVVRCGHRSNNTQEGKQQQQQRSLHGEVWTTVLHDTLS